MRATGAPEEAQAASIRKSGRSATLERNLVIHLVALEVGRRFIGAASAAAKAALAATAAAAAVQHHHRAVEAVEHDLGGIFFGAVLVGPFAGLQRAFQVNLGA